MKNNNKGSVDFENGYLILPLMNTTPKYFDLSSANYLHKTMGGKLDMLCFLAKFDGLNCLNGFNMMFALT